MPAQLGHETLRLDDLIGSLSGPEAGAIVIFLGCVRATEDGKPISGIRYEAYEGMAGKVLDEAAREARERFSAQVVVRHRSGLVPVGEPSLVVACSAAHRAEAFAAARSVIERIKRDAPIWKVDFK